MSNKKNNGNNAGNMDYEDLGKSNFGYSGVRVEDLGASELTLVSIAVDVSISVQRFEGLLRKSVVTAIESCRLSPRADNILVRVFLFSQRFPQGIEEIHGYKPLAEINTDDYPNFKAGGNTPLYDANYNAIGATNAYGKKLFDNDFVVNAINFILTDGEDTSSKLGPKAVADEIQKALQGEYLDSVISVLIGINADHCQSYLEDFKDKAGLNYFINAGDATPDTLARIAQFVSQSVHSQSQAVGSGGPSKDISATI